MSDKPILFSAPMVKALLAGTKTQTRRGIAPARVEIDDLEAIWVPDGSVRAAFKPRIQVGDRLYVREHWRTSDVYDDTAPRDLIPPVSLWFEADDRHGVEIVAGRFRQGMHMPRWASRLTLTVTEVRVERLQAISEDDARAEGSEPTSCANVLAPKDGFPSYRSAYGILWDAINGDGAWATNPWVAAYTFTVERKNIDARDAA